MLYTFQQVINVCQGKRLVHVKKHLSFAALKASMAERFRQIQDPRQPRKVDHCMHDVLMSGFAMMFFQDPSLLAFQKRLQDSIQQNNLSKIFGVDSIPKDSQMRDILDQSSTAPGSNLLLKRLTDATLWGEG